MSGFGSRLLGGACGGRVGRRGRSRFAEEEDVLRAGLERCSHLVDGFLLPLRTGRVRILGDFLVWFVGIHESAIELACRRLVDPFVEVEGLGERHFALRLGGNWVQIPCEKVHQLGAQACPRPLLALLLDRFHQLLAYRSLHANTSRTHSTVLARARAL